MTNDLDPLLASLARLAPATDAPPEPGSTRYDSILEHAMTNPATDADLEAEADVGTVAPAAARPDDAAPSAGTDVPDPRRRAIRRSLGASVAVAAVLVVGLLVVRPGDAPPAPTPAAALRSAADATAAVTSLRATSTMVDRGTDPATPAPITFQVEVSGDAARLTYPPRDEPGLAPEFALGGVHTQIGLDEWFTQGGETTHTILDEEHTNLPFASSSAAVVRAALSGAEVEELGTEAVRGDDATHYRITLDRMSRAALAALSPRVVAQFELEYPQDVQQLDIWVADDLIRRIRIDSTYRLTTTEFYDFGADITITPPA